MSNLDATNAERQSRHRDRVKQRLEREALMRAALERIASVKSVALAQAIARAALEMPRA